jgi:hypothetical protein
MPAVEPRRSINTHITELLRRVGAVERYAARPQPQTYALRPAALTYTAVTASAYTLVFAATVARSTRGVQAVVSAYADAGTSGDLIVRVDGRDAPPVLGAPAGAAPVTAAAAATVRSTVVAVPAGPVGDLIEVQVWVRRVTGTGSVRVAPLAVVGVPG